MTATKRVLVIEDEVDGVAPSIYVLKDRLGLGVDVIGNVLEATDALRQKSYSFLVVDIRIPEHEGGAVLEFGGIELIERLHSGEFGARNANTPYIFLTHQSHAVQDHRITHNERCRGIFKKIRQNMVVALIGEILK